MSFYDEIYLPLEYSVMNKKICQTILSPEFQRLKFISQTSSVKNLFPAAVHSRFEYSIGTAFLSQIVLDRLKKFWLIFRCRYKDFKEFAFSFDDSNRENPFYYQPISKKAKGNFKKVSFSLQNMSFGINDSRPPSPDSQSILSTPFF